MRKDLSKLVIFVFQRNLLINRKKNKSPSSYFIFDYFASGSDDEKVRNFIQHCRLYE